MWWTLSFRSCSYSSCQRGTHHDRVQTSSSLESWTSFLCQVGWLTLRHLHRRWGGCTESCHPTSTSFGSGSSIACSSLGVPSCSLLLRPLRHHQSYGDCRIGKRCCRSCHLFRCNAKRWAKGIDKSLACEWCWDRWISQVHRWQLSSLALLSFYVLQ